MTASNDTFDRTGILVAVGVFLALMVDGMDLQMLSLALPSISKDLHLSSVRAGALGTYTLIGMGVGGAIAGWLADRIGRVRVVQTSVVIFSVLTGAIALCHTYWELAIMRFASGIGLGSLYSVGTLLATEFVPTRMRTTVLGTLQAGWSVGYVVAALLSSYLLPRVGWRSLFACAVAPGLITLAVLWKAPDPPSWLATRRSAGSAGPHPFWVMWQDASVRTTFLLWSVTSIALQFAYYGANTWLPSYLVKDLGVSLQNTGWYVAGTYTMMVVGKIITGLLADLLGRRAIWVGVGVAAAVYLPILIYTATASNVAYLLLAFGFLYGSPYAVNATYQSESFPANVRGTAVAMSYNVGRIGSIISPVLIGVTATNYSIGLGMGLLGISYAICALVPGIFIREKMYDPKALETCTTKPAATITA